MHFLLIERSIIVSLIFIQLYEASKVNDLPFTTMAIYLSTVRFVDQETCMNINNFNYACITFEG